MNAPVLLFLLVAGAAIVAVPRRWAILPLLIAGCYMTRTGVELGPFNFTVMRLLVCIGLVRTVMRGELRDVSLRSVDFWMAAWGAWMVGSVVFHDVPTQHFVTRLGFSLDGLGLYVLVRTFSAREDPVRICSLLTLLILPLAMAMVLEKVTVYNPFSMLGGVPVTPTIRDGKVRAQGPFSNSILAGTVGATCLLLSIGASLAHRARATMAVVAASAMIYASTSSGPILTTGWGLLAMVAWPLRSHLKFVRWGMVGAYGALMLVMSDPPYFLMARIDLTGSSTGWHRARIIQAAFEHLDEWWFAGTDYTRHWMPYGIQWSPDHVDITNHYLQMGVLGGLPLLALLVMVIVSAFSCLGSELKSEQSTTPKFFVWAVGATLFAHAVTFLSVSYYDQTSLFFHLTVAIAAGLPNHHKSPQTSRVRLQRAGRTRQLNAIEGR